jgi:hypothetical protein
VDEGVEENLKWVVFIKQVDEVVVDYPKKAVFIKWVDEVRGGVRNMVVIYNAGEILYLVDDNNLFI